MNIFSCLYFIPGVTLSQWFLLKFGGCVYLRLVIFESLPPVFGVRRSFLQPQEGIPGGAEWETADPIPPLLLRSDTHTQIYNIYAICSMHNLTSPDTHTHKTHSETHAAILTTHATRDRAAHALFYTWGGKEGGISPWQLTRGTQCTCRSCRRSPWQRLRSTKRIWTWVPGR